jgi:hypothetical protein
MLTEEETFYRGEVKNKNYAMKLPAGKKKEK